MAYLEKLDKMSLASTLITCWIGIYVARAVGLAVYNMIYNLYWHPLAKFSGPTLAACTDLPHSFWFFSGRQPYKLLDLHKKYGPVVRTAPNELSFNSAQSWKDIYGFRHGHDNFIKSDFYDGGSFTNRGVHSIVSERDVNAHGQMRKYLSHAFSDSSLSEQEDIVSGFVHKFTKLAGERGQTKGGWDIGKAFEMMTFDIIGDLAFGESFGGLESDTAHPWIEIAMGALTQGALADMFKRFPNVAALLMPLFKSKIAELTENTRQNEDFAIELVSRRISRKTERKDFMTRILQQRDPEETSDLQLAAHASDFVLAGSETTATALSTITYYVLRNPDVLQKLQSEIRGAFKEFNDINSRATLRLPYLRAVILEGLRIYPPLPLGLPRVVPEKGDTVDGHFLPGGVIVHTNPVAANFDARNFTEPEKFLPERWLGGRSEDILDASQPFSLGPRGCIGRNLGWMELRLTLATLIWQYDLYLMDQSLDWHRDSEMHTLWRKPKLMVKVTRRREENAGYTVEKVAGAGVC